MVVSLEDDMHSLRTCFFSLLAIGCYNPLPVGQQCGPKGECVDGYFCASDNHCYKKGGGPPPDMSVQHDLVMACTDDTCKGGPKPKCDPESHACVDCLTSDDCAPGKLCMAKACVAGCDQAHPCPSGMCVNGMCSVCKGDPDCAADPNGNHK